MANDTLSRHLQKFTGTPAAKTLFARGVGADFSRDELITELKTLTELFPASPLHDRIFGVPDFLEKDPYSTRSQEWDLSRSTLARLLREFNEKSNLHFSFSHTAGAVIAIAAAGARVGVDLERADRKITDAVFARFSRPEESEFVADRLDLWTTKEACFKAHPNSAGTLVTDFIVSGRVGEEYSVKCTKGEAIHFRVALGSVVEFRYAFARVDPKSS